MYATFEFSHWYGRVVWYIIFRRKLLPVSSGKKQALDGRFLWNIGARLTNYDIISKKDMLWKYFYN